MTGRFSWAHVVAVYAAAFVQGLTLVSFPATSSALRSALSLSDSQYGAIFLPQVALAVAGALAGGALARRIGLQSLLWMSLVANAVSQLMLALAATFPPAAGYGVLLAGTACLGLGFGLLGAPMNSYPQQFFPRRADTAVVAVHTLVGIGLTAGPLLLAAITGFYGWMAFPLLLLGLCVVLSAFSAALRFGSARSPAVAARQPKPSYRSVSFWVFAAVAVLYAFAEGTFSNWTVVYLQEGKQLPAATAALALTAFWGTLVAGRLVISALVIRVPAIGIWLSLPILMIVCFWLLPLASTPVLAVLLFGAAGLACSAFFPLTIAIASKRFAGDVAWVSSMLIAALMVGVGLGSFVVGALREMLAMEQLYRFSAAYPVAVLMLASTLILVQRKGASA
jgi:fucose permease